MTLSVLFPLKPHFRSPQPGAHMEDPTEVGLLITPTLSSMRSQCWVWDMAPSCQTLGNRLCRARCWLSTRLSFSSGLLPAGKQLQQEQKKNRGKKPQIRHISPFSCCCCSLQSLPHPQQFGWKNPNAVFGFLWREALAQLLEYQCKGTGSLGVSPLPWNSTLDLGKPRHWPFPRCASLCLSLPGACYYSYDCPHLKKDGIEPLGKVTCLPSHSQWQSWDLNSQVSEVKPGLSPFYHATYFPAPSVVSG